ncbi:MAG: hypothetical protein H8D45_05255 [Bacteroidetes bacterium]|nr:hypothetical protein [Bacteroidota bacterium]MBL7103435.1 hypothetical protein [Bacteroidales bacterium]
MKNSYAKIILGLTVLLSAFALSSNAQIYSTSAGGPWDSTWAWVGGVVPGITHDVIINGPIYTSNASCHNLTLNASGSLYNNYFSYTLTVTGNVINHGTISDYVSQFYLNIGGNITNNGVWNNLNTTLTGSTDHYIACQNNQSFSGYSFLNNGSGSVYINNEAYFDNVVINLNNLPLILASNATLKIHDGNLYQCNVSGTGSTSVVFGEGIYNADAPHFDHVSFTDISFQGDNNIGGNCSTHGTVTNNGSLQNDYYQNTLVINDNFINNGTIRNWVGGLNINVFGNFTNDGILSNNNFYLYGTSDQTLTELNANSFNTSAFTSYKPSGKLKVLTDIDFLNCQVNMNNDTMLVENNSTVKLDGSFLSNTYLIAEDSKNGNLKLDMNETSGIGNCHVFNPEILGMVKSNNNDFYGNILVTDTLENNYYGYTLNIHGNITNNGVIQDYVSNLVLNIEGNLINNGVWNNTTTNLSGTTDQHIECTYGNKFSGHRINDNNSSGDIIIDNIVYFDNVQLHFNNHNLILPANTLLKIHNGYLYQCNLSGSGETSVVNGEGVFDSDAPFYQYVSFTDISFLGDNNFSNGCSSFGTVVNNGSLQNDYFGQFLTVNDNFINNGIIQNWVSGFTLKLYGDFTNNGTMTNHALDLYGITDQTLTQLNSNSFDLSYMTSFKPTGKIIASTDLTFNNVNINLEHDTLIVPDNSTISVSSNRLFRADILPIAGRFNLFMENSAYIHECNLNEVSLSGTVDCNNTNVFYGTTINEGVFQNDYYSYTVVFNGDFINNGTIKNDVSALTMNTYGNVENNGIWDNTTIGLYSTNDQEVFLDAGQVFSPSYFYSYKPSGKIIALSDLSFDNVDINLEHDTLIMPDNSTLSLSNNRLYRSDIHATSGRFNLFMENDAYIHECNVTDVTFYGNIDCNNGNVFYGTTINEGIFQNDYYQYWVTFAGDLINNNTIQNWISAFIINVEGNITNNGAWTNHYTQMNGTADQYVHLQDGHDIDGRMVFVSDVQTSPYQWYWDGWLIVNPPYPQPAVWGGESSNALNFLVPVANNRLGTYYCSTGGGLSRNIIVDEVSSMRLDITAFLEGPFNGTGMNTDLNSTIPSHQPYNTNPWDYYGAEAVASIPNANVVDWVLIELRDAPDAASATTATIVEQQAAFLLNDGSVVGMNGTDAISCVSTITNNLFVVIWHRNHLGIMTASPVTETGGVYTYDYTTPTGQAYGTDAQKNLCSGIYGMYAGDGDANGNINSDDKTNVWSIQAGTRGYKSGDYDMNGQVMNQDKNDVWIENGGSESQVPQ